MTADDHMLTLADAAEQCFGGRVSVKTLREKADSGELQAFRIGRHWWTTRAAIGEMAKCLATSCRQDSSTLARAALEAAAAARPVLDTELPVAISRLYDEIDRLRASHARLLEACKGLMTHEAERAKYAGLSDCTCINHSHAAEMAYETDRCPHQVARAAIEAAEGGVDGS